MADKLAGEKGSWFEREKWQKMVGLGSRNLREKIPTVEDADERLFVSEIYVPTIEQKGKEVDGYDRHIMGYSRQKGTWNIMVVPSSVGSL